MMSLGRKIKPLRPSASLILNLNSQGSENHRYLTLIRNPHMSFANSIVFPGGVCEPIDDKYLKSKNFSVFSKITAIRETTQQTGILLLPPNVEFTRLNEFKQLYRSKRFEEIEEYISKTWSQAAYLTLVKPILRLLTPQINKASRYDCIFYILDHKVKRINLGSSSNLQILDIDVNESSNYFWKYPNQYLTSFLQADLQIPPPQRIIFSALENLKNMGLIIQNLFQDQNLFIQPFLFQFCSRSQLAVCKDLNYKLQEILDLQPQSLTSNEVKQFLRSHLKGSESAIRRKIHLNGSEDSLQVYFEYTGMSPQLTLFKYLLGWKSAL